MKILAFYLPQFHEIPENNEWWGKGFTDWTNVKKAKPLFVGHQQPREPLNNNYYDLSDVEVMKWQSKIAQEHGVHGFCYYHYWFNGKKLLERPLENMLKDKEVTIPFCFSWANEPWARTWDGRDKDVLMAQEYGGEKEWQEHFDYLLKFFKDDRYIKIDNKPMLLIYRTENISDVNIMYDYWEKLALKNGFNGIYLVETLNSFQNTAFVEKSSAMVEFEPMYTTSNFIPIKKKIIDKIYNFLFFKGVMTRSYDYVWSLIVNRKYNTFGNRKTFVGSFVDWDNTPRKGKNGLIFRNVLIDKFKYYFSKQIKKSKKHNSDYIFINAWNEWAEGTYLEPDKKNGIQYLEVIKDIINAK